MNGAYTLDGAAAYCGVSRDVIDEEIRKGNLIARYPTSRPVILREELDEWLASLPTEKPKKKAS